MLGEITVWIVVPVFNRVDKIYSFINQMLLQTYQTFKVIIVDHGTTDIDYSAFNDSRIIVLKESSELWWTGAINRGVRYVLSQAVLDDFILIINDDVYIEEDYLQSLVDIGTTHLNCIVGSVCVDNETSKIICAGFSLNRIRARFMRKYHNQRPDQLPAGLIPSDTFTGRGTLIPVKIFEKIGLFSEKNLPHYGADVEFTYRAKKSGYHLLTAKNCIVKTTMNTPLAGKSGKFGFIKDELFGIGSRGNIPAVFVLSFLCFEAPYNAYYFILNATRKTLFTLSRTFNRIFP